jgi:hypothetical protein
VSSYLYDSLPQGLREVLDQMGESEVAKQIYADLEKSKQKFMLKNKRLKKLLRSLKVSSQRQSK